LRSAPAVIAYRVLSLPALRCFRKKLMADANPVDSDVAFGARQVD
jgi:hypothetical protein